jgi:squalene cyclase
MRLFATFRAFVIPFVLTLAFFPAIVSAQATPGTPVDASAALARSVDWLNSQQQADGGWIGFSGVSDVGATIDAVIAIAAARNAGVETDLASATAFLETNGKTYAEAGAGQAAKLVLVAVALGQDPTSFAGLDSVELMQDGFNSSTDMYGTGMYDTALVSLALGAIGNDPPDIVLNAMRDKQIADGSWAFDGTTTAGNGDTNTTAVIIQALVATKHTEGDLILHGIEYLQRSQLPQGFAFQPGPGAQPDANSTALVVQALIAAGEDPTAQEWQNVAGSLLAFQNENGSFSYQLEQRDDNLFATVQAIPAIAGQALPVMSTAATPVALPTCTPERLQATPPADADLPCAA